MSREGLPTALATTPNEFNAPFLTPNNLDSPHLPLPGGTRPQSAGGMRVLSPSRPGPSNTSLPSLPELTLVLPASTLQGSTQQGSTPQGSTQQGSTQQGSAQQGYNQQGPVQGHSGATLGRSTSGSSSSWQPGRHSMGPSSPSGSKQRPTPVLLTEMFNFPGWADAVGTHAVIMHAVCRCCDHARWLTALRGQGT